MYGHFARPKITRWLYYKDGHKAGFHLIQAPLVSCEMLPELLPLEGLSWLWAAALDCSFLALQALQAPPPTLIFVDKFKLHYYETYTKMAANISHCLVKFLILLMKTLKWNRTFLKTYVKFVLLFYRRIYSSIWLSNWVVNCERNSWLCRWFSVSFRELVVLCQCDGSISCCTHVEWTPCFPFMASLSR